MKANGRSGASGALAVVAAVTFSISPCVGNAQTRPEQFRGSRLAEALRALEARGLRIVFTSNVVTPELRVDVEPRGSTPREQLDELLAPHHLKAESAPGGVIRITRVRAATQERPDATEREKLKRGDQPTRSVPAHREQVTVTPSWPYKTDRGIAAETSVERTALHAFQGDRLDQPMRTIHALPRVSAVDDFRSDFVIRGSPFRHAEIVVDGVSASWLQHTIRGRTDAGSLSMLTGYAIESATLRVGAYPRRYGDHLGAQLDLALREGNRSQFNLRGAVGGTNATIVGEGPVGRSGRGSWLVALRHSYREWPPGRPESTGSAFGFSDALARVVYDVRPNHQFSLSALGGFSAVDGEENVEAIDQNAGTNRAGFLNFAWRSTLRGALVFTQRISVVREHYDTNVVAERSSKEAITYRAGVARAIGSGTVEAVGQIGRTVLWSDRRQLGTSTDERGDDLSSDHVSASCGSRSALVHAAWRIAPSITLSPGVRVSDSGIVQRPTLTRWVLGEWALRGRWTLNTSAGVAYQFPELDVWTLSEPGALRPERAAHLDLGIEHRVTPSTRWQVTVFQRRESDVLREPDDNLRLAAGVVAVASPLRYANALNGSSRGIELSFERRSETGLSGWASYSFGRSRYTDAARDETFPADFDQPHSVNLFGVYTFPDRRSRAGATLHAGSNFPISGYLSRHGDALFVGANRNRVRLPAYARLDVHGQRGFDHAGKRLTLFVEVLNVFGRRNLGRARGSIDTSTGMATGFTAPLLNRRVSGGLVIEF